MKSYVFSKNMKIVRIVSENVCKYLKSSFSYIFHHFFEISTINSEITPQMLKTKKIFEFISFLDDLKNYFNLSKCLLKVSELFIDTLLKMYSRDRNKSFNLVNYFSQISYSKESFAKVYFSQRAQLYQMMFYFFKASDNSFYCI